MLSESTDTWGIAALLRGRASVRTFAKANRKPHTRNANATDRFIQIVCIRLLLVYIPDRGFDSIVEPIFIDSETTCAYNRGKLSILMHFAIFPGRASPKIWSHWEAQNALPNDRMPRLKQFAE
jgi:hypothetical protein